jgi:hypothetical protein
MIVPFLAIPYSAGATPRPLLVWSSLDEALTRRITNAQLPVASGPRIEYCKGGASVGVKKESHGSRKTK